MDTSSNGAGPASLEAPGAQDVDVDAVGARVEQLLSEIATVGGTAAAQGCEELVAELLGLYGAGLARILALLRATVADVDPVLRALADDELVAGLLVLHDLHPVDTRRRIEAALDEVRGAGGDVSLVDLDGDVLHLRLPFGEGGGGCGSPQTTLRQSVEEAVRRAAPEISRVEVDSPTATPGALISAESLSLRPRSASEVAG